MHHTVGAGYCSGNREGCLRGTRVDVLLQLEHWLEDRNGQHMFWLNGLAGTGKSTIAQTFAEIMFAEGKLGASFFCSRNFEDRSNIQAIFPTLALQLAYRYPPFREQLLRVLRANPGVGQESLCSQLEKVIVGPFKASHISTLIIIDALDECKDIEPASAILSVLSRYVDEIPEVRFFITGRPEPRIRSGFRLKLLRPITEVLKLHEVKPEVVDGDIKLFFQTQLASLAKDRSDCDLTEDWPTSSDIEILCKKAAGFFIYASTVVKFIASEHDLPTEMLALITSPLQSTTKEGMSGVDQLYTKVLEQAFQGVCTDNSQRYFRFRAVVGAVLLVFNPLSTKALSDLLRVPSTSTALRSLHSLLLVPDNIEDPVHIYHKSFPDFLTDPNRCKDKQFLVDPSAHHRRILLSCLNLMGERLRRNICHLDDHAVLSEVEDLPTCRKTHIGDALGYACQFWTRHLVKIPSSSHNVEEVYKAIDGFFTTHFLFWIEVLCLMGNLNAGVYALNDVQQWCMLVSCVGVSTQETCAQTLIQAQVSDKWTYGSQWFLLEFFDTIHNSPSQIYHFALPLCPPSSWLHNSYTAELLREVKVVKGLVSWGTCFRTVALNDRPQALAYWKDIIAVGLRSGDIVTLDGITGTQVGVLSGHTSWARSLNFSPDGTLLVSGSNDETLKLWDVQTGGIVKTFHGHTNHVYSTSISPNCITIASGSRDKTIRLWNIQTGECCCIIEQQGYVEHISFSPTNPEHPMFVSNDVVQWWDVSGYKIGPAYNGSYAALSLDGTHFALCGGMVTTVQNSDSRAIVAKCPTEFDSQCCCFSPNGRLVAIAAGTTAYIWDITGSHPCLIETFIVHAGYITSLTFSSSSSLISASDNRSVKFWQIGASLADPVASGPNSILSGSAPIISVSLQAESGIYITYDSNGVVRVWDISTGLHKASFQTPAKDGLLINARMIDGRLVVVWLREGKIYIWDTKKDKLRQVVDADSDASRNLRISGDGSKVFLLAGKFIWAWSLWTGKAMGEVELEDDSYLDLLCMSGSRIYLHFPNSQNLGWDFGISGSSPVPLPNPSSEKPHLDFIGGSSYWYDGPCWIKNTVTGKEVFQLSGRYARPNSVQWDGRYLIASYRFDEVLILDFDQVLSQ
jgi:WD40 repeat protein